MPTAWGKRQRETRDARWQETKSQKAQFERIRRAENQYAVRLRGLARQVGVIVNAFPVLDPDAAAEVQRLLREYSKIIQPWAKAVSTSMLAEVSRRDEEAWVIMTRGMSEDLKREIAQAPTGATLRQLQVEQLKYITKIPLDAAQRVQDLTIEGLTNAARASEIAKEIRRQGQVSESYANLVARTEVGRASTNLTQARASYIGSEGYIWRTSEDSDVRPSHRKLEGTFHRWDNPPVCDPPSYRSHPGAIFNCRCYPEVVIPDQYK